MATEELKTFAKSLAVMSGSVIRGYFRTNITAEIKSDLSPVTIADKKAEELMREAIMKEFPEHGIIGEEFGVHNPEAEYQWILDPVDGTKSFICGVPLFGTLIALTKNGMPVLGVINLPVLDQFLQGDNYTAELNGKNVKVRSCSNISEAVLLTTDYRHIGEYQDIGSFNKLVAKVKIFRTWGDCYGYYLLATGFADIMIDPLMSVWDLTALIPIIKGAGGIITDYQGGKPEKAKSIIAASQLLHAEVIQIINSNRQPEKILE